MTNPTQTIPGLTAATALGGTEQLWINQNGTDLRTTTQDVADLAISSLPTIQNIFIGLGENISSLHLLPYTILGQTNFYTTGFYTAGDGGGAQYYHNTGSSQPGDQVTADGVRLSLSLSQQLTWEMLGAPTTGAICTATISGTTMTTSSVQSGTIAIGQTVTAVGGTGAVASGTTIVSGSGTSWQVSISQTVGPIVVCMNDSYPYFSAAQSLGPNGLLAKGKHYFSQALVINGASVNWSGPNGFQDRGYLAQLFFPSGYGALVVGTPNVTANAQGDVSYTGNVVAGGGQGSIFNNLLIQIGNGTRPAALTNNRPALGVYTFITATNLTLQGADGDGISIIGDTTHSLSDGNYFYNIAIQNVSGNGIETFGGDANANRFYNCVVSGIGLSGIYDHCFLGNSYFGVQSQLTGLNNSANGFIRRSNNLYYSLQDNNLNNDPVSSPTFWQLQQASVGADTWDSGTTYNVGAVFRTAGANNRTDFFGCYSEGGSPPALFSAAAGGVFLTTLQGGIHGSGILQQGLFGYNGQTNGIETARTYLSYYGSGYGFDTTQGSATFVGYRANNVNTTPGSPTTAVFDTAINNVAMSRFAGKTGVVAGHSNDPVAYISAWNLSAVEVQAQYWDSQLLTTAPFTDNTWFLGDSSHRWADTQSVKINGSLPGIETKGDTAATLTVGTDNQTVIWNTVLTADRAVTLSTTGAVNGSKFRVVRNASATGAFNLNVGTGPLKALGTAGTWVDVEYNGSAWVETASGSL